MEDGRGFEVQVRRADGATVVRVVGELDSDTAEALRAQLLAAVAEGPTTLELDALDFVDSAGLSVLIAADRRARACDHALTVTGVHGMTRKLLAITGLDRLLTLDPPPA